MLVSSLLCRQSFVFSDKHIFYTCARRQKLNIGKWTNGGQFGEMKMIAVKVMLNTTQHQFKRTRTSNLKSLAVDHSIAISLLEFCFVCSSDLGKRHSITKSKRTNENLILCYGVKVQSCVIACCLTCRNFYLFCTKKH